MMYGDVEAYPNADIVDFHVRGKDHKAGHSDWRRLRVVLEKEGEKRWLVGLLECEWTP